MREEYGFVYCAVGEYYLHEAFLSIKCLRQFHSEPITLFTDLTAPTEILKRLSQALNVSVVHTEYTGTELFFMSLKNSPYPVTISLETDCFLASSIDDIANVSQKYELAFSHNPQRVSDNLETDIPFDFHCQILVL